MTFDNKPKILNQVFSIILALAMVVPVSMMFSTNAIAEPMDTTTLTGVSDSEPILEDETPPDPPTPPEIVQPEDFILPDIPENITYEEPKLPIFEHVEEPYNITLVTMNYPTGPLYEGKRRPIQVILRNKAEHNIFNINVNIYDRLDDGEPEFLTDLFYGCIPKEKEQTKTFTWEPVAGTHYLTLNISYVDNDVDEFNEEEFGFYVIQAMLDDSSGNEYSHGSYQGPLTDWTVETGTTLVQRVEIAPGVYRNELILDEGQPPPVVPTYIFFHQADIIVKNGGILILDGTQFPIICDLFPGQYSITVENGGTLEVLGDSLIIAQNPDLTYGFEVYGTLNVLGTPTTGPTIQWMYGDPLDEKVPAGIQLYRGSAALFEYATIRDGKSHNIYADGAEFTITGCDISGAQSTGIACGIYAINGAEMHVGGDTLIERNGHSGIYSVTGSVNIDGATVKNNPEYGVADIGDWELQPGGLPIRVPFEPWGQPTYTGGDFGYYIWLDDSPQDYTWHVRCTGDGTAQEYRFEGIITAGLISSFTNQGLDPGAGDTWSITPTSISFTAFVDGVLEKGFDFRIDKTAGRDLEFDFSIYDAVSGLQVPLTSYIGQIKDLSRYAPLRLWELRPPRINGLTASDVKRGLWINGRALGKITGIDIQAGAREGILLNATRFTEISKGIVESKERAAVFLYYMSDHNNLHGLQLSCKNILSSNNHGLVMVGSGNNYLELVEVAGPNSNSVGFGLVGSGSNVFQDCTATSMRYGYYSAATSSIQFIGFKTSDCEIGMVFWGGSHMVSSSSLTKNGGGIYGNSVDSLTVTGTDTSNNGMAGYTWWTFGIEILFSSDVTVTGSSTVNDNFDPDTDNMAVGIFILDSDIAIGGGTEIKRNDYGIYAWLCTNLAIGCPYFIGPTVSENNQWGIAIFESHGEICDATITSNRDGVYVEDSAPSASGEIQIIGNRGTCTISNHLVGYAGYGIYALNAKIQVYRDIFWSSLIIEDNAYGITIVNSVADIRDATITGNEVEGIYAYSSLVTVIGNDITMNMPGIILEKARGEISQNTIMYNPEPQPGPPPVEYTGIRVKDSTDVWIHDNNISWNGVNICLYNSSDITIEGNTMVDASVAIVPVITNMTGIYSFSSQMIVSNNIVYGCVFGMRIENADSGTIIRDNDFYPLSELSPHPAYGLYLENAPVRVEWNTFDGIDTGIYCKDNSNAVIESNTMVNGGSGIHSIWSSPTIKNNIISGNLGWDILCEFGAPTNAGDNGQGLIVDNNLGDNELGWIKQIWDVQIQVTDAVGTPQDGVLVEVIPNLEILPIFTGYTDAGGLTDNFIATQYIIENSGNPVPKNPHVVLCDGSLSDWLFFEDNGIYVVEI